MWLQLEEEEGGEEDEEEKEEEEEKWDLLHSVIRFVAARVRIKM